MTYNLKCSIRIGEATVGHRRKDLLILEKYCQIFKEIEKLTK